jgi:GT2 family glycosyltransferase
MLNEINVHCVFGDEDADHVEQVLLPSLLKATKKKLNLRFLNYTPGSTVSISAAKSSRFTCSTLLTISNRPKGFAANHNILFEEFNPRYCFLIINPDCIATENMIDVLISRFEEKPNSIGLVEASQWPYPHPKEFDQTTGATPWASGACVLVNSKFYRESEGMDERYFLYVEDVDLSWESWLAGYEVIHQPNARVIHFTSEPHRNKDSWGAEYLFGLRNHVLLIEKYYGRAGKKRALKQVRNQVSREIMEWVTRDLDRLGELPSSKHSLEKVKFTKQIKFFGKGLYHRMEPR